MASQPSLDTLKKFVTDKGQIASFFSALSEGLFDHLSDAVFTSTIDDSIRSIYQASIIY